MIEDYWVALYTVSILTGVGYFYLMAIKARLKEKTPWWIKAILLPQVVVFLILDWLLNILLSVIMADLPATVFELTTHRMKRYKKTYGKRLLLSRKNQWQLTFATVICKMLNRGEKDHC